MVGAPNSDNRVAVVAPGHIQYQVIITSRRVSKCNHLFIGKRLELLLGLRQFVVESSLIQFSEVRVSQSVALISTRSLIARISLAFK